MRPSGSTGSCCAAPRRSWARVRGGSSGLRPSARTEWPPIADAVLGRWFTPRFRESAHGKPVVDRFRAILSSTPREGYAGCCEAIADMDLREDLPSVTAPTLVLAGADDPATPPEHGRLIAELIPGAHFEVVSPAAHLATIERPDLTTAMILRFLTEP